MSDPIATHRKEVLQRLQSAHIEGFWEGTHTDFKRQLDSTPRDRGKLLNHLLAFANTPRRTDAYLIFGVEEERGEFKHNGLPAGGFPPDETINSLIHDYTTLRDIVVDGKYLIDGKATPYIMVPLQFDGPYVLTRPMSGAGLAVVPGEIYCRYGSSSMRATERDVRRMQAAWERWFLDCRYETSATTLMAVLTKRFPATRAISDAGHFVRLIYDSDTSDEFGSYKAPVLVHAYSGFDPVPPSAVARIVEDTSQPASRRTLIGARFSPGTREAAEQSAVRCILLDEIYFVNDPYAQLCRAFLRRWTSEREGQQRGLVVDLDYHITTQGRSRHYEPRTSVLTFLEEQLQRTCRAAIIVHGAFGCGKTTTAKELAATLSQDYLRGDTNVPKVLYVDVNNLDIRSRRDECIASQLMRYPLVRDVIDQLIALVRDDEVHLLFDGVDEMAKPYTPDGRSEAIDMLREVGNRRTAVYFIRSAYYPQLDGMLEDFSTLADVDFKSGERRIIAAEIRALRPEQVTNYLDSRLGGEDSRAVRMHLGRIGMESFLGDPLIISLLAKLVEDEGIKTVEFFPTRDRKARFLSRLVGELLDREQRKRQRHGLDFGLFHRTLRHTAYKMISGGVTTIEPARFEAIIRTALGSAPPTPETVEMFRTISWIHRSEDGTLAFRHEALTLICAAEWVCSALADGDVLSLSDWQTGAPLADVLYEYAADMIDSEGLLAGIALLGGDIQHNIRQLVVGVLQGMQGREDLGNVSPPTDPRRLGALLRGVVRAPQVAQPAIQVLFRSSNQRRAAEVGVPLLYLLSRVEANEAMALAMTVLELLSESSRNFCGLLREMRREKSAWLDSLLLKDLKISEAEVVDGTSYEEMFNRVFGAGTTPTRLRQYAERTLSAIEEEKHRRNARHKQDYRDKRPRRH